LVEAPCIFGTDGVRDEAGRGLLAEESVRRLVQALLVVLDERERFGADFPHGRGEAVYIGRDTRSSGGLLLEQVSDEILRSGREVVDLGVLPTPGVARVVSASAESCLGIVLSASHNPARYNGIKLFSARGAKISEEFELAVSAVYRELESGQRAPLRRGRPRCRLRPQADRACNQYMDFLAASCERPERLRGRRVVLDTANGAAFEVAPQVFRRLGALVECIGDAPSGSNINEGCGALEPASLAAAVSMRRADLGFCFDGDADRVIPVTASGSVLDGDYVLALAGRRALREGKLPAKTVVATVMSNLGLEKALRAEGIELRRTPVGDRNVLEVMEREGHPIGGEQSGHLIFLDRARTGDGILAALRLLDVLESDEIDLDREASLLTPYPQILRGVKVGRRVPLLSLPDVAKAVASAEARLGSEGRVLLRYSGTEPLVRVMVEGPAEALIDDLCGRIVAAVSASVPR
jgi:phosphoglucosamine mutase